MKRVESKETTPLRRKWSCGKCGYFECICIHDDDELLSQLMEAQDSRDVENTGECDG